MNKINPPNNRHRWLSILALSLFVKDYNLIGKYIYVNISSDFIEVNNQSNLILKVKKNRID